MAFLTYVVFRADPHGVQLEADGQAGADDVAKDDDDGLAHGLDLGSRDAFDGVRPGTKVFHIALGGGGCFESHGRASQGVEAGAALGRAAPHHLEDGHDAGVGRAIWVTQRQATFPCRLRVITVKLFVIVVLLLGP